MSGVALDMRFDGRDLTVGTHQDVEAIIEHNKVLQTLPQKSDWGRHVASIPLNIINPVAQRGMGARQRGPAPGGAGI